MGVVSCACGCGEIFRPGFGIEVCFFVVDVTYRLMFVRDGGWSRYESVISLVVGATLNRTLQCWLESAIRTVL